MLSTCGEDTVFCASQKQTHLACTSKRWGLWLDWYSKTDGLLLCKL